jgi:mono/diheme cytochrome c family protein
MKKTILILVTGMAIAAITLAFTIPSEKQVPVNPQDKTALFPDNIAKTFETSCYDCHGADASNAKAKAKLNFGNWADLSDSKKVAKLENIAEVVSKGDMPPGRYIEKNAAAALSQEQKDAVGKWAKEESDKLLGTGK